MVNRDAMVGCSAVLPPVPPMVKAPPHNVLLEIFRKPQHVCHCSDVGNEVVFYICVRASTGIAKRAEQTALQHHPRPPAHAHTHAHTHKVRVGIPYGSIFQILNIDCCENCCATETHLICGMTLTYLVYLNVNSGSNHDRELVTLSQPRNVTPSVLSRTK